MEIVFVCVLLCSMVLLAVEPAQERFAVFMSAKEPTHARHAQGVSVWDLIDRENHETGRYRVLVSA